MRPLRPLRPLRGIRLLDQTRLPLEVVYIDCADIETLAEAISSLRVRGAPAIGIAAAYGMALATLQSSATCFEALYKEVEAVGRLLATTRPTAVNLFWAISRMERVLLSCAQGLSPPQGSHPSLHAIKDRMLSEAHAILAEDIAANQRIGAYGAALIESGYGILTHCHTGAIATGGHGTALGIIRSAWEQKKKIRVYATESRPLLQGARLTAWELQEAQIPVTLITDSMAGFFMRKGEIHCVVVGADRVAKNGDVANKIGTYTLSVLAKAHGIPFYVAAPISSIDLKISSGEEIPIEERSPTEITHIRGIRIAPEGVSVSNPAFDMTPASYISAIITEGGVFRPHEIKDLPQISPVTP